jgi:peptide-methionine (S)-S-oxide reductase
MTNLTPSSLETATLGGGCFWCLEAVYKELRGVTHVESGYSGGFIPNPSYQWVCTGRTGHVEVVQVTFDPAVISYADLLEIFFTIHDPTTPNRQGNDIGPQYRSVIFTHSPEQQKTAEAIVRRLETEKLWPDPIVTELAPIKNYYTAEDYHQDYFANNPGQPYCQVVVAPKVAKFRKQHFARLRA